RFRLARDIEWRVPECVPALLRDYVGRQLFQRAQRRHLLFGHSPASANDIELRREIVREDAPFGGCAVCEFADDRLSVSNRKFRAELTAVFAFPIEAESTGGRFGC